MTKQADVKADALHVTNGDCTVPELRRTGLARRILVWRDVLHEGPVPDVGPDELRRTRAAFLTTADERVDEDAAMAEHPDALGILTRRDQELDAHRDGEYVLWFEADLYDQLQLAQILARLAELDVPPERITLVCIGEFPGIAHFGGLGELDAEQLRGLPDAAGTLLSAEALDLATRAWAALRVPHPGGLGPVAAESSAQLRFLPEAFDRLSREYPSIRDGLSLTERRVLAAAADGARTAGEVFRRAARREARPYLGDLWCFRVIARLADAPAPLLELEAGARITQDTPLRLTPAGLRVLHGHDDHLALNGTDRWIGGVHLTGHRVPWRWDDSRETITDADPRRP